MNRGLKRVIPLIVALAATGAWAEQGPNDTATPPSNDLRSQSSPSSTPYATDAQSPAVSAAPSTLVPGRITLYEYPNFAGPRVTVDSSNAVAQNLDWANFNNPLHRAESAKVEGGTWRICSMPSFQGTCRTLGPGDYASFDMPLGVASAEPVLSPQLGAAPTPDIVIVQVPQ